jgi:hypothetical protein
LVCRASVNAPAGQVGQFTGVPAVGGIFSDDDDSQRAAGQVFKIAHVESAVVRDDGD